ncbi:MAG: hypothetical protein DKT66_23240 [Candidatus Melainabacteria bacterium]|nr:MAG: hypothetical protein DKT66_23240 [Candidatus Melainabacteria bacterium]
MELNHQKQRLQTEIDELKNELRQAHKTLDFEKFWTLLDAHPLINAKKAQINLIEILIQLRTAQQFDKNSRGSEVLISRPVSDLCDRIDLFEIALKALSNRLSQINKSSLPLR